MSIWTDENGRRHVGVMVGGKRVHRILPEGASASDSKHLEAELRGAMAQRRPSIPGDPPLSAVMPVRHPWPALDGRYQPSLAFSLDLASTGSWPQQ